MGSLKNAIHVTCKDAIIRFDSSLPSRKLLIARKHEQVFDGFVLIKAEIIESRMLSPPPGMRALI